MFWIYLGSLQCKYCSIIHHWKAVIPLFQMWLWIYYNSHTYSHYIHCKHISSYSIILLISNPNIDFENVHGCIWVFWVWLYHQQSCIHWNWWYIKYTTNYLLFFSENCISAISWWFSYQYMAYYISLESYEYPLSNGILSWAWILCIHLLFIIYSIIFVLKYLGYFQYNYHCIKVWDVLENHCYPPITPTHFLEWISLQYYDITMRIMWVHSNLPWLLTL